MNKVVDLKSKVRDFWDSKSCGEIYADVTGISEKEYYESHSRARYNLEPYIFNFAKFHEGHDKDVLEIGIGMGADHVEWAKSQPRTLTGIDLTPRAIEHTQKRLTIYGLKSEIQIGDAEKLPFNDGSFDLVYSWGVLHHSPNTSAAINEVLRVLRPKGTARIMIYHKYSLSGYMLWARYGLLTGHPFRSLKEIYANYMESPGTKAYSINDARDMLKKFSDINIRIQLSFGDLLQGAAGQKHRGILLTIAKKLWPRSFFKQFFKNHGLGLLIEATKP